MTIADAIYSYLPAKRKNTPSGWIKFNAVCCAHNSTSADTRARGGMIRNADGVSYHCFNCGFKASYISGRHLTRKMRQLLQWLNASDDEINKLAFEAMRIQEDAGYRATVNLPVFEDKTLPEGSIKLDIDVELNDDIASAIEYIYGRGLTLDSYDFYWSPEFRDRIIIPFKMEGRVVGYTARKLTNDKPKYISDQTPGYVFNLDEQNPLPWQNIKKHVLVVEGPMDALSINGVALLGAEIMDKQALLINRLGMEPVVLPDRDRDGLRTAEQAMANGWAVAFPEWHHDIKDANDAVRKYGKLYTLYSIFNSVETNELKIKLRMKQWLSSDGYKNFSKNGDAVVN